MTSWTSEELRRIEAAEELVIAPQRGDGTLRTGVPIWVVRVGDDLYVRSYRGSGGAWYRAAQASHAGHIEAGGVQKDVAFAGVSDPAVNTAVDAAYRSKYRRYPQYVEPMLVDAIRATTLKLMPR